MWLDALRSIVPLFVVVYVILQHYSGYIVLSSFLAKAAWIRADTTLLDVIIDLGVSVLLSRQVVDIGDGGVAETAHSAAAGRHRCGWYLGAARSSCSRA